MQAFPNTHGRQRGAVLLFALIALVVMTLAAISLVRSVDTATLIAGNLAFKQSATSSGDGGVEAAITWLSGNAINPAALNTSNSAMGYYNSINRNFPLTAWGGGGPWPADQSRLVGVDNAGNSIRYVIQRMCTHPPGQAGSLDSGPPAITADETNCLFSDADSDTGTKAVLDATQAGGGLAAVGSPIYRVTVQVTGPRNTVSYIQAFVF